MNQEKMLQLISALLAPTFETMQTAGIARLSIDGHNAIVQLKSGEVFTVQPRSLTKETLGQFIAWSLGELGTAATAELLEKLDGKEVAK